jgi:hypothetical protein
MRDSTLKRRDLNVSHTLGYVGRNVEIIVSLVSGLVVTPQARDLVRHERTKKT